MSSLDFLIRIISQGLIFHLLSIQIPVMMMSMHVHCFNAVSFFENCLFVAQAPVVQLTMGSRLVSNSNHLLICLPLPPIAWIKDVCHHGQLNSES